jgi:hypothetical protein
MMPIKDTALYYICVSFRGSYVLLHKGTKLLLHLCNISMGVTLAGSKVTPIRNLTGM